MSDVQSGINSLRSLGALGSTGPTPEEQLLGLGALGPDTGPDYIDKIEGPGDAFTAGIQSGILNLKANAQNFKASVNTLVGRDRKAQSQLQEADLLAQDASVPLSGMEQFDGFLKQPTFNGFMNQVAAATGQFVPSLVVSMAAAAATGGVATTATALRTTGAKLASGKKAPFLKTVPVTTESLRQQKSAKQLRSLLERSYKNSIAIKKGKNAPFPITKNEQLLLQNTLYPALKREALQRAGIRGALVGAGAQEFVQGSGIAFGDYAEQGMTSVADVLKSYAQGTVFAGIGVGSEALVAGSIINTLKKGTSKFKPTLTADGIEDLFRAAPKTDTSFLKDIFRVQTTTAFSEGIAEALQEELSIQQKFSIDDAYTQANAKLDRAHALFAGFFGGVGVGTGLGTAPAVLNKSRQLLNRGSYKEYLQQRYDTRAQEVQGPRGQIFKQRAKNIKEEFDALFNPTMKVNAQYTDIDSQAEFNKALPEIEKAHPGKMENVFAIPRPGLGVFFTTNEQMAEVANNLFTTRPYEYDFHEQFLATNLGYTRVKGVGDDAVVGAINKKTNEFVKFQTTSTEIEENNKTGVELAVERMKSILGKNYDRKNFDVIVQNIDQHLEYRRKGIVVDTTQLGEQGEPVRVAFEDIYGEDTDFDQDDIEQRDLSEEAEEESQTLRDREAVDQKLSIVRGINTRTLDKTQTNALNDYFEQVFPEFAQGGLTFKNLLDMANYQARIAERTAELKTGAKRTGIQSFEELSEVLSDLKKEDSKKAYKEALTTREKANYTKIHNRIKAAAAVPVGAQEMDISPIGRSLAAAEANPGLWASSLVEQIVQQLSPTEADTTKSRPSGVEVASEAVQALNSSEAKPVPVTEIVRRTTLPIEFETPETEVARQEPATQEDIMGLKPVRTEYDTVEAYENALQDYADEKAEARLNMVDAEVIRKRGGSGTIDNPYLQYIPQENRDKGKNPSIWKNYSIDENTPKADRRRTEGQINQSYVHVLFRPEIDAAKDNFSQQLIDDFVKKAKALNDRTEGGNFLRIVPANYLNEFRAQTQATSETVEIPLETMREAKEFVFVKHQIANSNELVRRNVNEFRDIYEDIRTRIDQAKERAQSGMGFAANKIHKFSIFQTKEFGQREAPVDMGVLLEGVSTIYKVTQKREAEELELSGKRYGKNVSFRRTNAFNDFLNFAKENGIYIGYSPQGYNVKNFKINVVGTPVSQVDLVGPARPEPTITPQQTIKFYYDLLMNPNTLTTKGELSLVDFERFQNVLKAGGISNRELSAIKYGMQEAVVDNANKQVPKLKALPPTLAGEVYLEETGKEFIKQIEPAVDQNIPKLVAGVNGLFVQVNPKKVEKGTQVYTADKVLDYLEFDKEGLVQSPENIKKSQEKFTLLNEYKIVPDVEQIVEKPVTKKKAKGPTQLELDFDGPTINIFAGTKENAHLSNFAPRPFVGSNGRDYISVEHGYQSNKTGKFNKKVSDEFVRLGRTPLKSWLVKNAGKPKIKDDANLKLMKSLITASFEQNPAELQKLIATGDTTLTHIGGDKYFEKRFPEILMEVRAELGAPGNQMQLDLTKEQAPVVPIEPKEEESTGYYLLPPPDPKSSPEYAFSMRPDKAREIISDMTVLDLIATDLNSGVYDLKGENLSLATVVRSAQTPFDALSSLEYMIENGKVEPRPYEKYSPPVADKDKVATEEELQVKLGKDVYLVDSKGKVTEKKLSSTLTDLEFLDKFDIPTLDFNEASYEDLQAYISNILDTYLVTSDLQNPKPLLVEASSNTPLSNLQEASSNIIVNPAAVPLINLYNPLGSADLSKRPKNTKFPEHKVIVAGSRTFSETEVFNKTLDKLFGKNKKLTIVSGMAKGADTLAVEYAKSKNLNLAKFPILKNENPMNRNSRMAEESTSAVIFFSNINKPSPGSLDMLKKSILKFGPSNVFAFDIAGRKAIQVGDPQSATPASVSPNGKILFEPKKLDYAFKSGARKGKLTPAKEKQFKEATEAYQTGLANGARNFQMAKTGLEQLRPLVLLKELAEDVMMRQQDPESSVMTNPINEWIGDALVLESAKRHQERYLGGGGAISTGVFNNELDNLIIAPEGGIFPAEGFDRGAFRERQSQIEIEKNIGLLYKPMKPVKENKVSSPISETPQAKKYKKKTGQVNPRPFRRQILNGILSAARRTGLLTNIKILHDNEIQSWMRQPGFNLEGFEEIRKNFLDNPEKIGMNVKYQDFDVIVLKNDVSEGTYYMTFMHELGEAFVGQELEKSLKVKSTRDKLMKEFEKARASKDAPKKYLDEETGFNEFIADQFAVAIRKNLNIGVNETADQQFENMAMPIKSWFKRLVRQLETFFKAAMKAAGKGRFEMNEEVQEYIDKIATNLNDPSSRSIPYQTKAKIERQIEDIFGPETFTEKSLNGVIKQMNKLISSENMPKWMKQVFYAADNRLRALGKNIPKLKDGRTVGAALADFYYSQSRSLTASGLLMTKSARSQAYVNEVAKALDAKDSWLYATLNSSQRAILLEAESDRPTKDISVKAQKVRAVFKKAFDELGLKDLGVDFRDNFFPRLIAIYDIAGDDGIRANLINLLMQKNPKKTRAEIEEAVTELVKKGKNEIDFEAATNDPLDVGILKPYKDLFNNVTTVELRNIKAAEPPEVALKKYFDKAVTRSQFENKGGVAYLRNLMDQLSPEEQIEAQNIQDAIMGRISPIQNGILRIANNVGLVVNIITLLGFAVLASLPDLAGPVLRSRSADTSQIFNVLKNYSKNREEMIELSKEIGVIGVDAMSTFFINAGEIDFMNEKAKTISNGFFRLTGLEAFTRFSRVFATGMGKQFMIKHAEKAKRGDSTSQTYLQELQVTADEVLAWSEGKANPEITQKVNDGLVRFVDESIVRPNSAERPVWASDPRYALIWQLKSFYYAYGKTIMGGTFRDSMNNAKTQGAGAAVMPLLFVAMMLLPITMLGWEIREFTKAGLAWLLPGISPDDAGVDYYRTNTMTNGDYWVELIDRTGMLGPASMALPVFLEDHRHGKPFWLSPLGPTAERLYDGVTWDWQVADYIPGYSQLDTRALSGRN
jgi:predicted NAD-dependent protein-ADP-ribosyltransferase YbiA (DUF1768 family)